MSISRRKYTTEFKVQVTYWGIDSSRSISEVAGELGSIVILVGNRVRMILRRRQAIERSNLNVLNRARRFKLEPLDESQVSHQV